MRDLIIESCITFIEFSLRKVFSFINTIKKIISFSPILFFFISCSSNNPQNEISRGIYFWKTNFSISPEEQQWLNETGIKKLYIRFFDVDWNPNKNSAVPVGDVLIQTKDLKGIELIPVVFITNRTLKNIPDSSVQELSHNIFKKIHNKLKLFSNALVKEIQLDCDWTQSTKEKYFNLIESFKKLCTDKKTEVTVTIRLHQVKFFDQTGIPPVKRGALMFYNMSDVSDSKTKNSIFNKVIAKNYLVNFDKYPLDLDVILPAFSWCCIFRGNKLNNLVNDVEANEIENNSKFVKETDIFFRAKENQYFKGLYILKGDYLRLEDIDVQTTLSAAELISPHLTNKKITISLYHLNGEVIKNYDKDIIEKYFFCFQLVL